MSNLLAFLKELIPAILTAAIAFIGYFLFEISARFLFNTMIENPTSEVFLGTLSAGLVGCLNLRFGCSPMEQMKYVGWVGKPSRAVIIARFVNPAYVPLLSDVLPA